VAGKSLVSNDFVLFLFPTIFRKTTGNSIIEYLAIWGMFVARCEDVYKVIFYSFSYHYYIISFSYHYYDISSSYHYYDISFSYHYYIISFSYHYYDIGFSYHYYDISFSYHYYIISFSYHYCDIGFCNYDIFILPYRCIDTFFTWSSKLTVPTNLMIGLWICDYEKGRLRVLFQHYRTFSLITKGVFSQPLPGNNMKVLTNFFIHVSVVHFGFPPFSDDRIIDFYKRITTIIIFIIGLNKTLHRMCQNVIIFGKHCIITILFTSNV